MRDKNARNSEILMHLWKWKVASTFHVWRRFFPNYTPHAAYKRLGELKRAGLVEWQSGDVNHRTHFWTLTSKGFAAIRQDLPVLREDGFRSETIRHDFLSAAFQLGDWLERVPDGTEIVSEQQLRRFDTPSFPSWVPRTELHRPDGYSRVLIDNAWVTIAFEIELNHKHDADYENLAKFYEREESVFRVLWLVKNASSANYIQKRFSTALPHDCLIHDFVSLHDFSKHGWRAPILHGFESGKTVSFLLNSVSGTLRECVHAMFLVDGRITPYRSPSYAHLRKTQNRDRLGLNPSLSPSQNSPLISTSPASANIPAGSEHKAPSNVLTFHHDSLTTKNQGGN